MDNRAGIKIAICGKGGVGKTTVCAVLGRLFAADGLGVLAIDADSSTNLCSAFGIKNKPVPLIEMKKLIADRTGTSKEAVGAYFRLNPKVNDLPEEFWLEVAEPACHFSKNSDSNGGTELGRIKLLVLGGVKQAGGGCECAEAAFLRAMLRHVILNREEVVLVDLSAGIEFLGRASVEGVDALVVVVEPGQRSIETALEIAQMGKDLGIKVVGVIGNKISNDDELQLVKSKLSEIIWLGHIGYNRSIQQADLEGRDIVESCPELLVQLQEAKEKVAENIFTKLNRVVGKQL